MAIELMCLQHWNPSIPLSRIPLWPLKSRTSILQPKSTLIPRLGMTVTTELFKNTGILLTSVFLNSFVNERLLSTLRMHCWGRVRELLFSKPCQHYSLPKTWMTSSVLCQRRSSISDLINVSYWVQISSSNWTNRSNSNFSNQHLNSEWNLVQRYSVLSFNQN